MKKNISVIVAILCTWLATPDPAGAQTGPEKVEFPEVLDQEGFLNIIARTGRFFVSGQPDESGLSWAKEQGVGTVICLRTQQELDNRQNVPFDEDSLVHSLGMKFVHIPQGGEEHPYSPKALEKFAKTVNKADGKILLHCTVGWRASHLWAAYLVRFKGMDIMEAVSHGQAIYFGTLPFERFLGGKITYTFEETE